MTRPLRVGAATLIVGSIVLAATLATRPGTPLFYALGLVSGAVWIVGAYLAGPVPWRDTQSSLAHQLGVGVAIGAVCFGGFVIAKLVSDSVPLLASSVAEVLKRADAGPRLSVLVVALVSGAGEEVFFRGALFDALRVDKPVLWTTAIYGLVTVTTLHVALVAAALIMGLVFAVERRRFRGVLVPTVTHLTWSALVLFYLPRTGIT